MKICKVEKQRMETDVTYEVCNNEWCCKMMKKWLRIDKYNDRRSLLYNTDTGRFELRVRESTDYSFNNENTTPLNEDLLYCPFCGTKLQEPMPKKPKTVKRKKKKWFVPK